MDEARQPLSRKLPIPSSQINPYRMIIMIRLVALGFFFHYRVMHPVNDAYALWLISVICEIWFAVSWILDQFPKWLPIDRETYLDRLSLRYEKEGQPSQLCPVDIYVSTVDPLKEPPLVTANTVLSILAVDYPVNKISCYVSDDGAAMLTFEALSETSEFAKKWVPFCKKFSIEPRAPEWYFAQKIDYLKDKVLPSFVKERRAMKREYEEFKVRINALVAKAQKVPEEGWTMQDGTPWPGNNVRDHPGMIQVFLGQSGGHDTDGKELPRLVYVSREKRPGFNHHKKAGAMNALVRVSAVLTNAPYLLNLDCDHYINNGKALRESMCFMMDPLVGKRVCYVQFPQRFDGIDRHDRYANRNTVFFDINMKGLDGIQGPIYVGTGCVFRRQALYGYDAPKTKKPPTRTCNCLPKWCCCGCFCSGKRKKKANKPKTDMKKRNSKKGDTEALAAVCALEGIEEGIEGVEVKNLTLMSEEKLEKKFGQSSVFVASTLLEDGGTLKSTSPASLLKEAIHVISCGYEDKTEWGKEVGWIYGSVTEDILTGFKMHCHGWRSIYCIPARPAFKGSAPINLSDRLHQVLRWALGSIEIFLSRHCPLWYGYGGGLKWRGNAMTSSSSYSSSVSSAVDSIHTSLADLCDPHYHQSPFDLPRRFSGFANRLQLSLTHLTRATSSLDALPPSVHTALKGIAADLAAALETLSFYRTKGKISVLINCLSLCDSLADRTVAISGWLALLDLAIQDLNLPDLRKKIADLSRDMKQAHFKVTEREERVHHTLQKEGRTTQSKTSKAVESAIIMDLARALGIDPENHDELSKQIRLLKNDVAGSNSVSERRILVSLERIVDNWAIRPNISAWKAGMEFEDDDVHISPFKNFLCPLTKEVMRYPVVLQSSQTYERTAINYWFERCLEDGRDPTCPVTGEVLGSLEMKPNIGLAGAIEEWVNRNVEILVKISVQHLSKEPPVVDCLEGVLDNVYNISEEYPSCRYKVRNAGVLVLIVKMLRNSSKSIGTNLRSKALMVLLSMAKDEESKNIMLQEGITRLAIHSLIGSSEKEKEYAVKLLLEFSSDKACCIKIATEKGALVLLSSMAGNLEHPGLSNLADKVLKQMEKVEDNVQYLAAAGRFEPLLTRLCEGSDDVKIEMAFMVGSMTLTNSSKEQIARQGAKILIQMLSKPEGRAASLQALYNLSGLDDNATILVDSAVLPTLTDVLFKNQDTSPELKELAASTMANIVSNPGHWELASADKEGHPMQSESFIYSLLRFLPLASPQCQISILHIIYGIASSPQASESVACHIKSGEGIKTILPFLEHPEVEHRIHAFKLTRLLSERYGQDIANELRLSTRLPLCRDKLLDHLSTDSERSDAACILANLSLSEDEVKTLLGVGFVKWMITTLKNQRQTSNGRISRPASSMLEGLLGLLLHITRNLEPQTLVTFKEHSLITIFCEHLGYPSNPRVKQLAALGLKILSEYGRSLAAVESERPPPHGMCSYLVFMCGRSSEEPSTCPIHNAPCEEDSQLCLLKSNSIKPLVDLLTDSNTSVQIAAVEALSTLVIDTSSSFKRAVDELEQLGVIEAVISLFIEVRPGELQERTTWIIERILRVDNHRHSLNQSLVWALVEAFKHGNANTKRHAQDALTSLKQLSAVSGKSSYKTRAQR